MKYYKLINDNKIIGAVSSNDFIRYSPISKSFLRCNEQEGEYISYKGQLYRATWMHTVRMLKDYIEVIASEIDETEYLTYVEIIEREEIIEDDTEIIPEPKPIDPIDAASIDFVRQAKISEMSYQCRKTIEAGIDVELRGETRHFSLDTQDQLNLMSLGVMAQTQDSIPYHADGEVCIFYTAEEINQIVSIATAHKVYHTTYYNALKTYINALETIEEISAITYGVPIPEEYKSEVLKVIEQ